MVRRIVGTIKSYPSPGTDTGAQASEVRAAVRQALVLTSGAYKQSATVDVDIPDTPALAGGGGDANDLAQVLINVVGNAYDAIDQRRAQYVKAAAGHIALQVPEEQDHCTVTDYCCGLPPDLAERVFDLFFITTPVGRAPGSACRSLSPSCGNMAAACAFVQAKREAPSSKSCCRSRPGPVRNRQSPPDDSTEQETGAGLTRAGPHMIPIVSSVFRL